MHTIRLQEPWEKQIAEGVLRWRRWFHAPTGLVPGDMVEIRFEQLAPTARVTLNGQPIAQSLSAEGWSGWEITAQLVRRNEVVVEVSADEPLPFRQAVLMIQ